MRISDRVRAALAKIRSIDTEYHAFVTVCGERALSAAEKLETKIKDLTPAEAQERYPLLGLTFAVKDNLCVEGVRTTAASHILENYISPYSATAVERLEAAGAICLGKTNLDEFAMGQTTSTGAFGATKNPRNAALSAGGSSGGSAAAVALDLVDFALGSDTGGSIRQPAALCGVVGFKPAYGTVSRYGLISYASAFDTIGPLAKSVADARRVYSVFAGPDPKDASMRGPEYFRQQAEAERRDGTDRPIRVGIVGGREGRAARAVLNNTKLDRNVQIEFIELPMLKYAASTYYILACAQAASNLARYDGVRYGLRVEGRTPEQMFENTRLEGFSPEVRRRILLGNFVLSQASYSDWYEHAARVRRMIYDAMQRTFSEVDVIVSETIEEPYPTADFSADSEAFRLGYERDRLTVIANLCGIPAVSVCTGAGADATPEAVMIMADAGREDAMFAVADALTVPFTAAGGHAHE